MRVIATDDSRPGTDRRSRKRVWWRLIALLLAISLLAAGWYYLWPRQIDSTGGIYFPYRVTLAVPRFAQSDERWGSDSLAGTPATMAQEGCAVSSAAMVLSFYGLQLDPGQLNQFLIAHDGYTAEGWLRWEKAADFVPGKAKHVYEDLPSFFLIDSNLVRGNPVIIRLRLPGGVTHFVVIVGKRGFHYLIQDPGSGGEQGVYPLDELTGRIEALRFYEKLSGA